MTDLSDTCPVRFCYRNQMLRSSVGYRLPLPGSSRSALTAPVQETMADVRSRICKNFSRKLLDLTGHGNAYPIVAWSVQRGLARWSAGYARERA